MTVMAPVSGLSLVALERFSAGLPLPEAAAPPDKQPSLPDVVVFSSAPMRVLSDLASAGLRQLAVLLPMIEQAVQDESAVPLGHLAKAATAAARQISDGHVALLAEGPDRVAAVLRGPVGPRNGAPANPAMDTKQLLRTLARQIGAETEPTEEGRTSDTLRTIARQLGASDILEPRSQAEPDAGPIQRWIAEAKHVLRGTGDALDRAEEQLRPLAMADASNVAGNAPPAWILTEILAAQAQIAIAYAGIGQARATVGPTSWAMPRSFSINHLAGATTVFGMLLVLATLWLIGGLWSAATGTVALIGTVFWVWRHTSASLTVQENADPAVRQDILAYFERLAPENAGYIHNDEGPDDMPAHLRTMLTGTQMSIPVASARPVLGTWQGLYLFEHRSAPHRREIVLHLLGE
jgi:secondary thiamine-phosphate synthase enzyme